MTRRLLTLATTMTVCLLLLCLSPSSAQVSDDFWGRLSLRDDVPLVLSVKYADRSTRARVLAKSLGGADLPFISRVIVRIDRDAALSLQGDPGVKDVEVFGARTADRTLHKLLELYRVYLYQVSGRFDISVVNFSQGVPYWDRNSEERGDRTIAEALDILGTKVAPVMVAIGDGPELGVGGWALAPSVLPVVATNGSGTGILAESARPSKGHAPWKTVLYADGEPSDGATVSDEDEECGRGAHLTADQMLHPEAARVPPPGGSSFATFKVTSSVCLIQQYSEILRVQLRARTPVGVVEVQPFVAYYVDSPVDKSCSATKFRWADQRFQADSPRYEIRPADKARLDAFVTGSSIELRAHYSIPILKAFLNHLSPGRMTDAGVNERYVSWDAVLTMLKGLTLRDLVEIAANRGNVRYQDWIRKADADAAPLVSADLVDAVANYCQNSSLFLVLTDEAAPFFETTP